MHNNAVTKAELVRTSGLFAFLLVLFFWPVFFAGKVLVPFDLLFNSLPWSTYVRMPPHNAQLGDQIWQFYPWALFEDSLIKKAELPLWNPYMLCGHPFVGTLQTAVFDPIKYLFCALSPARRITFATLFRLFIAGVFTYLYGRKIGFKKTTSVFSAVCFMFSGFLLVWLGWPIGHVAVYLPALLFFAEKVMSDSTVASAAPLSLVLAVQLLSGQVQTSMHLMTTLVLYCLLRLPHKNGLPYKEKIKRASYLAFSLFLGVSIAMVQLAPFLEYYRHSYAPLLRTIAYRTIYGENPWSLPPQLGILTIIPDFFGNPVMHNFSLRFLNYTECTMYVGIAALYLSAIAILVRWKECIVQTWVLLGGLALCVIFKAPLIFHAVTQLPGWSLSLNHRLILIYTFSVCILAGAGIDLIAGRGSLRKHLLIYITLGFTVVICASAALMTKYYLADIKKNGLLETQLLNLRNLVIAVVFTLSGVWGAVLAAKGRRKFISLLVLTAIVDLFHFGIHYNTLSETTSAFPQTPVTQLLQSDTSLYRIIAFDRILPPNAALAYAIHDISGDDAMGPYRHLKFMEMVDPTIANPLIHGVALFPRRCKHARLLDIANVTYVLAKTTADIASLIEENDGAFESVFADAHITLYKNRNALERVRMVTDAVIVDSFEKAADYVQNHHDDLGPIPVIEGPVELERYLSKKAPDAEAVTVSCYSANKITIDVSGGVDGFVIIADTYFPGWNAYVDGEKRGIYPANVAFRAIPVSSGDRTITLVYRPASFTIGTLVSVLALGLVTFWFIIYVRTRQRPAVTRPSKMYSRYP
ncbi:MAG: YfhO family protein [Candidatus Omnitrophica bacterium]|nr:YfhO family protein [Candidatus Omnitrophota bacterium]